MIASTPKDFLDVEKARAQLARVISGGYAQCVTSFEGDPLDELSIAVPIWDNLLFFAHAGRQQA